ncbi:MAG: ABC transporter ATP-binding protein [Desulfobacteraceae bacterium]|nr:ABC transporter ATP-binding protein [Desulfobacteraceae bacterium]
MIGVTKKFGDLTANDAIGLTVHQGEIHALLGENGAGKSTLMNVLYGIYTPTKGQIRINGSPVEISSPSVAISQGIGMVHQHFMLVKPFTVTENIILGKETAGCFGKINMNQAAKDVSKISEKYGLQVDPLAKVQDITVGMEQRVEILKALYRGAQTLILDEPTAVLTPQEIKDLTRIIKNLTAEGKSIILITHKLKEIKESADYCTIIRRGKHIGTVQVDQVDEQQLASMMVGRTVNFKVDKQNGAKGGPVLEISGLHVKDNRGLPALKGLDLCVRAGEIIGVAGVDGNGQSELIEAVTGLRPIESGSVSIQGKQINNLTPRQIHGRRVSTIPEDRQLRGMISEFSIAENMILENYYKPPFSKKGFSQTAPIKENAQTLIQRFDVRPDDPDYRAGALSGGNQQKMIIARQIANNPDLLIAAQPTRGLDVGAIEYVHKALMAQRNEGKAVLLISLELDEIINLSDTIAIIYEGRIIGLLQNGDADEKKIGLMMAGHVN